jgi:phosphoglycerol transferase MdoB-like AlkP superfamily enzyme
MTWSIIFFTTIEGPALWLSSFILPFILTTFVVIWMLLMKARSLWWILMWWFVPFGCLFVLTLTNKRGI